MKITILKVVLSLGLVGLTAESTFADQVAAGGRQFLLLSQGARESAMGGSFAALSDDATGMFCNPAAMVQIRESEISLSHLSWIGRTNVESAAYAGPLKGMGMLGAGLSFYWIPAFDNTGGLENAVSPLTYEGQASYASYLKNPLLSRLSFGGSLKYAGSSFGDIEQTSDLTLDLGLFYNSDWKPLSWGIAAQNISLSSDAASPPAFSIRAGASVRDGGGLLALEVLRVMDQNFQFQLGGEYWLKEVLAFRAGFKTQDRNGSFPGISLGVGLKVDNDYRLDYAASTFGDLGLIQWISLRLPLGPSSRLASRPETSALAEPSRGLRPPHLEPAPAYQRAQTILPKGTVPTLSPPYRQSFDIFQQALAKTPGEKPSVPAPITQVKSGSFHLSARVKEDSVELNWTLPAVQAPSGGGYNIYASMVPGADFVKLNASPVSENHWSTELGLHGMTYYFLVTSLGASGEEIQNSEVKDVQLP